MALGLAYHIRQLCPLSLRAASYRYSPKSAVRTASGGQRFVDRHSLRDTPCPPHGIGSRFASCEMDCIFVDGRCIHK
jgi:hypothetical protein